MPETVVIDTNVILVADGRHPDVSPDCVSSCALSLKAIVDSGRLALDAEYEIVGEYQNKTDSNRAKGPGAAFVKWVLRNRTNPARCDLVALDRSPDGEYSAFPRHPDLSNFDPPDRKFVAVSAAHPEHPPILEASDSKWIDWASALEDSGIPVRFLCPGDLKRFHASKFGE